MSKNRADKDSAATDMFAGGEMGRRMRETDWAKTPLGAVSGWSQSLKTVVGVMLTSRFPMVIWWGRELVLLYNDGWRPILGENKDKIALGNRGRVVWTEIWDVLGPMFAQVLDTGEATWNDDGLLLVNRYGFTEEAYFTWSYSPIRDDDGSVGGVFTAVTETTKRVIGERRLQTLRDLAERTAETKTADQACRVAAETLAKNPNDLPFALVYLIDREGKRAELCETAGIEKSTKAASPSVVIGGAADGWNFTQILRTGKSEVIEDLETNFGAMPVGAFGDAPNKAIVLPLAKAGTTDALTGFLVVGLSPNLAFDADYRSFAELVAGHLTTAITNTRALEEEKKRAEKLAELDRAKTEFFSNVSHEFRTPLTLMLGNLEEVLQKDSALYDAEKAQIETAYRNSLRLLKLVNNLLDFSRIEAGKTEAHFELTDLSELTADLASNFRAAIEKAGMCLEVNCPKLTQTVAVDREMWEKIVLNLISNAFKFTLKGKIEVSLTEKEKTVELKVRDTGVGIPADELPHVFERFHRVRATEGRTHEGTGIGLSLVRELVRLHSGAIAVESELGKGTTFSVSIPVTIADDSAALQITDYKLQTNPQSAILNPKSKDLLASFLNEFSEAEAVSVSATPLPFYPSVKILLTDDNADMRGYIARLLTQNGYEVATAADGKFALEILQTSESLPDLILSDVMMPRLDGFGLLAKIRQDQRFRELPVILLSARAGEEAKIEGLEAGADDYLIKPFSMREMLARVESSLKLARLRRESVAQIEHQSRVFDTTLSSISDFAYIFDKDGRFAYSNQALLDLLGITLEEIVGKNFFDLNYPKDLAERLQRQIQQVFESKESLVDETPFISPTGAGGYYEYIFSPVLSADGAVEVVAGSTRDITERKQAEEKLRESEEKYRTLFDSIDEGFSILEIIFDSSGKPIDYMHVESNPAQTRMTGIGSIDGRRIREVLPDIEDFWIETFGRVAVTGEPARIENYVRELDRWFDVFASRLSNKSRQVAIIYNDVTERKQAEIEREKMLRREQELRLQAEIANRLKDEFLATVSHELRTPLNAILGWSSMLQSKNLTEETRRRADETIYRSAKSQAKLIEDILDVSRIITGKMKLEPHPVDLADVVKSAINTLRPAIDAKSINLELNIESEVSLINGDVQRLQQIIWNLVSNAIKFTPRSGEIKITLENDDSSVRLNVSDTGKGIEPEFLPFMFERFRQEDGSSTRRHGGLGLGLAIVHHLVELHGGAISVHSDGADQGSTFTIELPLLFVSVFENQTEKPSNGKPRNLRESLSDGFSEEQQTPRQLAGARIIFVDDELDTLEMLNAALSAEGAEVRTANSAAEAFEIFLEWQPDVLVSDIAMPEEDGYSLIKRLRELATDKGGKTPAIAMTAYVRVEDRLRVLKSGFQMYVPKPAEPFELIIAIDSLRKRIA